MQWACLLTVLMAAAAPVDGAERTGLLTAEEALALPQPPPDERRAYGPGELAFGELRLPEGNGPFPVVMVIHGGCWLAAYDLGYMSGLADRLTRAGFATWSVEYRRVGDPGGGWPGTFDDVAAAADALRDLASEYPLDLGRTAVLGHSAGGHLALWLAARPGLDASDPLRGGDPFRFRGVVSLAGITDLEAYAAPEGCGAAVPGLLDGEPGEHRQRLLRSSPVDMPAPDVPVFLVIGSRDPIVPRSQAEAYATRHRSDAVHVVEVENAGHFELIDPGHNSWAPIQRSLRTLLDIGS